MEVHMESWGDGKQIQALFMQLQIQIIGQNCSQQTQIYVAGKQTGLNNTKQTDRIYGSVMSKIKEWQDFAMWTLVACL